MRVPLGVPLTARDGTLNKGPKLVNVYTELKGDRLRSLTRPGVSSFNSDLVGFGSGLAWIQGSTFVAATTTIGYLVTSAGVSVSTVKGPSGVNIGLPAYAYGHYWIMGHELNDNTSTGRTLYRASSFGAAWTAVTTMQSGQGEIFVLNGHIYTFRRFSAGGPSNWYMGYTTDASTFVTTPGGLIGPESFENELRGSICVHNGLVYRGSSNFSALYWSADPNSSVWLSTATNVSETFINGSLISFNGGLYLIGGTGATSTIRLWDGVSTFTTLSTGIWGSDSDMAVQSFDGNIWVFGGSNNTDEFGYYSANTSSYQYFSTLTLSTNSIKEVSRVSSYPFVLLCVANYSDNSCDIYRFDTSSVIYGSASSWVVSTLGGGVVSNPNEVYIDMVNDG